MALAVSQPASATARAKDLRARDFLTVLRHCLARLRPSVRKLRLCESLSLGERRTLAIVQFEGTRYLVGATAASITLLRQLPDADGPSSCQQEGRPCEP